MKKLTIILALAAAAIAADYDTFVKKDDASEWRNINRAARTENDVIRQAEHSCSPGPYTGNYQVKFVDLDGGPDRVMLCDSVMAARPERLRAQALADSIAKAAKQSDTTKIIRLWS